MVEVLIAVTILSILLLSIATAFSASAKNYKENTAIADTMNAARQAPTRMTSIIRTGQPDGTVPTGSLCKLITAGGQSVTLQLVGTQLKYNTSLLCDHVTALKFTPTLGKDSKGQNCVKSVLISMTVTIGDVPQTFSAATVVMPNL